MDARYSSIQHLRGIAALMVMLTHSGVYLQQVFGYGEVRLLFGDYWSYFGVIIFFCISGFLLTSLTAVTTWQVFLLHRIARIFPTYLIALVMAICAFALRDGSLPPIDWRIVFLVPLGAGPFRPLHVEWTLVYEVAFYVLLTPFCFMLLRRWLPLFLMLWLALLSYVFLTGRVAGGMLPPASEIYLTGWNIAFVAGGFAWLIQRQNLVRWWSAFAGVVLIFTCTLLVKGTAFFAPAGIALILAFLVQRDCQGLGMPTSRLFTSMLEGLGNWSYALYLTHVPVMLILFPLLKSNGNSPLSAWFCTLGIVLLVGALLGQVDVALYRRLKKRINARFAYRNSAVTDC